VHPSLLKLSVATLLLFFSAVPTLFSQQGAPVPVPPAPAPPATTLLSVCPDLELYPPVGSKAENSRPTLSDFWQQDYPILIYDARTQDRYWLEPPTSKKDWKKDDGSPVLTKLDRVFTPVTYTIEKPIIAVCGLHFGQTATPTFVSTPVPSGDQIDDGTAPAAAPAPAAPKTGDLSEMEAVRTTKATTCNTLNTHYDKTKSDLDEFKKVYLTFRTLIASSGAVVLNDDLFSSQSILDQIDKAYHDITAAHQAKNSSIDLASFEEYSKDVQPQSQRLTAAVNGYNAAVANKRFSTENTAVTNALATLAKDSSLLQTDLAALPNGETCGSEVQSFENKLSSRIDTTTDALQSIEAAQENLQLAQFHLVRNMHLLNVWYQESQVSFLFPLKPAAGNALLQVSFSVTDPPATALYKVIEVSDLKPPPPSPAKPTTVTIDKTDPKKVTVTVNNASTPAAVTINADTDGDSSVRVQVPGASATQAPATNNTNAPSGKSSDNITTGGNAGPAASITTTTVGKPSGNTPTAGGAAPSTMPFIQTSKSSFMERHRWFNFAVTGGFLGVRFTNATYSALTLPVTTITTTITSTSTSSAPTITVVGPTTTTANYAYATSNGPIQEAAVAGITWYLFGHDSYPVTRLRRMGPFLSNYADHKTLPKFGAFIGTSVNTLGTFTIGPSFDLVPGVQLYSGVVLQSRTRVTAGIVSCTAAGSAVSTTSTTNSATSSTGVTTTQTVTTQTTTGCANANATVLSNTTVPTDSTLKPAWGFGFLLNSDLLKYLPFGKSGS